ncbi:hypothetical protein [Mesorhizobium sp. f-mel]
MAQIHGVVLPDVLVRNTRIPRPRVIQTLRRLKEASRITDGRAYAAPLSSLDVGRIVLALSATTPIDCADHESGIGSLPLAAGDDLGKTAEAALMRLVDDSLDVFPFTGTITIGQTRPSLSIKLIRDGAPPLASLYQRSGTYPADGACLSFFHISVLTLRNVARELLKENDVQ